MKFEFKSWLNGAIKFSVEADSWKADLSYVQLLDGAILDGAILVGARLVGVTGLPLSTVLPTGETFEVYLRDVVPALLTAGGKKLTEVATEEHWNCHNWDNCPMAAAFGLIPLPEVKS